MCDAVEAGGRHSSRHRVEHWHDMSARFAVRLGRAAEWSPVMQPMAAALRRVRSYDLLSVRDRTHLRLTVPSARGVAVAFSSPASLAGSNPWQGIRWRSKTPVTAAACSWLCRAYTSGGLTRASRRREGHASSGHAGGPAGLSRRTRSKMKASLGPPPPKIRFPGGVKVYGSLSAPCARPAAGR